MHKTYITYKNTKYKAKLLPKNSNMKQNTHKTKAFVRFSKVKQLNTNGQDYLEFCKTLESLGYKEEVII